MFREDNGFLLVDMVETFEKLWTIAGRAVWGFSGVKIFFSVFGYYLFFIFQEFLDVTEYGTKITGSVFKSEFTIWYRVIWQEMELEKE